ncbi:hypothetical protein SAMN05421820_11699 [Pedobacter steynii]|uniref:Uncharacterized protein n=1 Tax=Pedobacter steynii TaxID=430522 RepID=A0A1H0KMI8_9SPHI|nr:hypothetical protein [Pedobacter steynii]NQX43331.1 hypothetical protein [Pedobacter steynii]SDO57085.1 hypothetical protein SAMN05421820_11699 [Pedobacter steynii]
MQQTDTDYHFILNCFSPSDIDNIITDLELHSEGYEFLYALDTYDVMENYLPYIEIELFSKGDSHFQAQKFICYDYFFGELNKTKCILLEEYKVELVAAKNKLARHLSHAGAVIGNLESLKAETGDFLNHPEKSAAFFRNNFEVILLLLILNDKSYTILNEFFVFIRDRLDISGINIPNKGDISKIERLFEQSERTDFSVELFRAYVENNRKNLISVPPAERHVFLENTFRDIQVIERVGQINSGMKETDLKYTLIYLSSARKTGEIFKVRSSLQKTGSGLEEERDTHRNVFQYFLFDRLKNEFKEDLDAAILILRDLRSLLVKLKTDNWLDATADEADKLTLLRVKGYFDHKSNILDNHFYYSIYEKYKSTFSQLSDKGGRTALDQEELLQIMREIDKNRDIHKSRLYELESAVAVLNQTFDVADAFWGGMDYEPEYRYGKDIIRNPYQHLPILPFVNNSIYPPLMEKLYEFLNLNVEMQEVDFDQIRGCVKEVIDELYLLENNVYSNSVKEMVFTYLNFVVQRRAIALGQDPAMYEGLEEKVILNLERQFEIIVHQYTSIDYDRIAEANKLVYKQGGNELLVEIVYMLLWLYRRNLEEDKGISRGLELINPDLDDPRIFQGIGLCYLSKVYQFLKSDEQADLKKLRSDIDAAIQYLHMAEQRFQLLINEEYRSPVSLLIIKNYTALLNSLADMKIRKYELQDDPDFSLISMARKHIDDIRNYFELIGLLFDEHPTYPSTEMEIEYFEALDYYNEGQINHAREKIVSASIRSNSIHKLKVTPKYVDAIFLKKSERLSELANRIIHHHPKK